MSFEIGQAKAEMLGEIAAMEAESFSMPWSERAFASELNNPDSIFLTASGGGELLGFVIIRAFSGEGELLNIAVRSAARGCGVGGALLRSALDAAENRDVEIVYLEVRESNGPALSLYKKNGFAAVGRRKRYYDAPAEDAILMARTKHKEGTGDK